MRIAFGVSRAPHQNHDAENDMSDSYRCCASNATCATARTAVFAPYVLPCPSMKLTYMENMCFELDYWCKMVYYTMGEWELIFKNAVSSVPLYDIEIRDVCQDVFTSYPYFHNIALQLRYVSFSYILWTIQIEKPCRCRSVSIRCEV